MNSLFRTAAASIVAAIIGVVITFFIADAISGPLLAVQPGNDVAQDVPLGGAIIGTMIGGIVGTILALLSSRLGRPVQMFTGICVLGLIAYGAMAFVAAEGFATGLWLNVMHLVAALPIVGGLSRWLGARAS